MVCSPRVAVLLATLLVTVPLAGCIDFFSPQDDEGSSNGTPTPGATTPPTTPTSTPTASPTDTATPTPSDTPPPTTPTPTPTTSSTPPPQGDTHTVRILAATTCSIDNYSPDPLTISVGDSVKWSNGGGCAHTATSTSGPEDFNTGNIAQGAQTTPILFDTAGTYDYKCNYHSQMTARIIVEA